MQVSILRKEGRYSLSSRHAAFRCFRFLLQRALDQEFVKEIAEAATAEIGSASENEAAITPAPVKEKRPRASAGQRKPLTKYQVCLCVM